jgi:hypothetical protein
MDDFKIPPERVTSIVFHQLGDEMCPTKVTLPPTICRSARLECTESRYTIKSCTRTPWVWPGHTRLGALWKAAGLMKSI